MRAQGFSEEVAKRIASSHRASTQRVYNSKWNVFCTWCKSRGRDPLTTTAPLVGDFLTHLFHKEKMCVSTLAGYRSVLLNTLKDLTGADFTANSHLKKLLDNFKVERPRSLRALPQWDLALVMRRLTRAPFEPLVTAPMHALSWKTAFLLALASAKRRSELRAFSYRVTHPENWSSVTLRPLPAFVAKTEVPGRPETRLQEVTLQGLASYAGDLTEDKKLCPVRAIKCYLSRSREFRQGRQELFVP